MRTILSRRSARLVGITSLVVILLAAAEVWNRRLELFVIPARWEQILELRKTLSVTPDSDREPLRDELGRTVRDFVELQRPGLIPQWSSLSLMSVNSLEGDSSWALAFDPRAGGRYLRYFDDAGGIYAEQRVVLAFDARGHALGAPFLSAGSFDLDQWEQIREEDVPFTLLRISSSFDVGIDAVGPVPLGFRVDLIEVDADRPITSVIAASTGSSKSAAEWFDWLREYAPARWVGDPPSVGRARAWIESDRVGDRYRGLYELERLDPGYSRLALRLMRSEPDHLRGRAVAVAANDRSLGLQLRQFIDDPSPVVRNAAAFALFSADDADVARLALAKLLQSERLVLPVESDRLDDWSADLGFERLSSREIAEALLTQIRRGGTAGYLDPGSARILAELRPRDLEPYTDDLLALWRNHFDDSKGRRQEGLPSLAIGLIRAVVRLDDNRSLHLTRELLTHPDTRVQAAVLEALERRETPSATLFPTLRAMTHGASGDVVSRILSRWEKAKTRSTENNKGQRERSP